METDVQIPIMHVAIAEVCDGKTFYFSTVGSGWFWPETESFYCETLEHMYGRAANGDKIDEETIFRYFDITGCEVGSDGSEEEDDDGVWCKIDKSSKIGLIIPNPIVGNEYYAKIFYVNRNGEESLFREISFMLSDEECFEGIFMGDEFCIGCFGITPNINSEGVLQQRTEEDGTRSIPDFQFNQKAISISDAPSDKENYNIHTFSAICPYLCGFQNRELIKSAGVGYLGVLNYL